MEETSEVISPGSGALYQMVGAEVDLQIATAHKFPRKIDKFEERVFTIITRNEDTAKLMSYELKRKDADGKEKLIPGPSVRYAEVIAPQYGNLRVGARVVDVGERYVTGWGMAWDLENNLAQFRERKGQIVTSSGRRYGDNMIMTVSNAVTSIAYREAVFKTIPQYLWQPAHERMKDWLIGDEKKLIEEREKAIAFFVKRSVPVAAILKKLSVGSVEEIDRDDVLVLQGIYARIKAGEATALAEFASEMKPESEESAQEESDKSGVKAMIDKAKETNPEAK